MKKYFVSCNYSSKEIEECSSILDAIKFIVAQNDTNLYHIYKKKSKQNVMNLQFGFNIYFNTHSCIYTNDINYNKVVDFINMIIESKLGDTINVNSIELGIENQQITHLIIPIMTKGLNYRWIGNDKIEIVKEY